MLPTTTSSAPMVTVWTEQYRQVALALPDSLKKHRMEEKMVSSVKTKKQMMTHWDCLQKEFWEQCCSHGCSSLYWGQLEDSGSIFRVVFFPGRTDEEGRVLSVLLRNQIFLLLPAISHIALPGLIYWEEGGGSLDVIPF